MQHLRIRWIMVLLAIGLSLNNFGQYSRKETIRITSLTLEQLKTQSYSRLAWEKPVEKFLIDYIKEGSIWQTKQYDQQRIDSLYEDSMHVYFVHLTRTDPIEFFKVLKTELNGVYISKIDGSLIRKKFLDEVIPKKDKEKAEWNGENCLTYKDDKSVFSYSYNKNKKIVEIKYRWKVVCGIKYHINKIYFADFDLQNMLLVNKGSIKN